MGKAKKFKDIVASRRGEKERERLVGRQQRRHHAAVQCRWPTRTSQHSTHPTHRHPATAHHLSSPCRARITDYQLAPMSSMENPYLIAGWGTAARPGPGVTVAGRGGAELSGPKSPRRSRRKSDQGLNPRPIRPNRVVGATKGGRGRAGLRAPTTGGLAGPQYSSLLLHGRRGQSRPGHRGAGASPAQASPGQARPERGGAAGCGRFVPSAASRGAVGGWLQRPARLPPHRGPWFHPGFTPVSARCRATRVLRIYSAPGTAPKREVPPTPVNFCLCSSSEELIKYLTSIETIETIALPPALEPLGRTADAAARRPG